ncbi:MAG: TRAM domain-containing protein [Acidimicrobiia bacterium]
MSAETIESVELEIERIAAGGAGVARLPDGMVSFIAGALPGERVTARIDERAKRFANGTTINVLAASDARVTPECSAVAAGCGGCDWAHIDPATQPAFKAQVVRDTIERVAGLEAPEILTGPELPAAGYRTTLRAGVLNGRAGYRRRASHELVLPELCHVAHPDAAEILSAGRFPRAEEVTIRISTSGGGRIVVCDPSLEGTSVPNDVIVVEGGADAWIRQEVLGYTFQVSADSFFQSSVVGAEALVETVRGFAGDNIGTLVDLYAGVGLFAALIPARSRFLVESNPTAVADARVNLDGLEKTKILRRRVEEWEPVRANVVVADPSRVGLGPNGVGSVLATQADRVILVSCDIGPMGRDLRLLAEGGYSLSAVTLVDMFPNTSRIEAVSLLTRS